MQRGETICSYKKLACNKAIHDTWTMAFRKQFGTLAQGDAKANNAGTNSTLLCKENKSKIFLKMAQIVVEYRQ